MFEALNYTPHDVVIYSPDDETILHLFPSVGNARASASQRQVSEYALPDTKRVPVMSRPEYGRVEWGTEPALEINVLVSIVAAGPACADREDLGVYVPDSGPDSVVRSPTGQILGVKRLIRWQPSRSPWQWMVKRLVDQGATVGGQVGPYSALIAIGSNPTGEPYDVLVFGNCDSASAAMAVAESWAPKLTRAQMESDCAQPEYSHILITGPDSLGSIDRVEIPNWRHIGDPSPLERQEMFSSAVW